MMSAGLTFGNIVALFGLLNGAIDSTAPSTGRNIRSWRQ